MAFHVAIAQESQSALIVDMASGETHSFLLSEKPEIIFEDKSLRLRTSKVEVSFMRSDIANCHFAKIQTSINQVSNNELRIVSLEENRLDIYGLNNPEETVNVYDLNGHICNADVQMYGNKACIFLTALPNGVYIIKIGNRQTIKIIRK